MDECHLQQVYTYEIYPRDSKTSTDKGFVNIDNGEQGGIHWVCYIVEVMNSNYFDSYGGSPGTFFLQQPPKPMNYHNFKIHDNNRNLCGSLCL